MGGGDFGGSSPESGAGGEEQEAHLDGHAVVGYNAAALIDILDQKLGLGGFWIRVVNLHGDEDKPCCGFSIAKRECCE